MNVHPGPTAIEALYRRSYPDFLRVATAIVGDRERARDAVHDAFVQAVRAQDQRRQGGSLDAWVWRIVVNAARKARRDRREHAPLTADIVAEERVVDSPAVRSALGTLTERQRIVLFLRYYADFDYAQIAMALGIREGTVGAHLARAHEALRPLLEDSR